MNAESEGALTEILLAFRTGPILPREIEELQRSRKRVLLIKLSLVQR